MTISYVCPYCHKGNEIYDISTMLVKYGPITFDDHGQANDSSYDHYEDLADTIEFQNYWCGHCDNDFFPPVPLL